MGETTAYHSSCAIPVVGPYVNGGKGNSKHGFITLNASHLAANNNNNNNEPGNGIVNSNAWNGVGGSSPCMTSNGHADAAINGNDNSNSNTNSTANGSGGDDSEHPLPVITAPVRRRCFWYEEDLGEDLRWSFSLKRILRSGVSKFQDISLLDTRPWGKVLILDGKMQSAEVDEFVYHECLVHPAFLHHSSPKNVFIMGGGEGATAREALRHKTIKKVVMCDIDREVVAFCKAHLPQNREAFRSNRFDLVINDARAELEKREERFDIVVGDLADPVEDGPCYQLYSKCFYERVLKPKLNPGGIFVTQAGPAGVLSHAEVFTSIYNTLRHVFKHVVAYTAHIPSYCDTWGWVMASDEPLTQVAEELDARIKERVKGELRFIDGATIRSSAVLNKLLRKALEEETHVYTEKSARFVYGKGVAASH